VWSVARLAYGSVNGSLSPSDALLPAAANSVLGKPTQRTVARFGLWSALEVRGNGRVRCEGPTSNVSSRSAAYRDYGHSRVDAIARRARPAHRYFAVVTVVARSGAP
jgi:hypothetical protein